MPAAAHLLRSWVRIPTGAWMFVCCECRVLSGRGLCDELITRPEGSYRLWCVVVCDLETSRIGAPYIYDISSLRVNDLTLILLTWRKWTPKNASKWQMGFNSAFKVLRSKLCFSGREAAAIRVLSSLLWHFCFWSLHWFSPPNPEVTSFYRTNLTSTEMWT